MKTALRQSLLQARQQLTSAERQAAAHAAATHLRTMPLFHSSQHIACYYPLPHEFDTRPMIEAIWQARKICYLPILSAQKTLAFARYQAHDLLVKNSHHIFEPAQPLKIPLEQLDLVLVPLVGFDLSGHRLGMGGGYYDKTFATTAHCPLFGVGFELQGCESIPVDGWDISLQGIVTERRVIYAPFLTSPLL